MIWLAFSPFLLICFGGLSLMLVEIITKKDAQIYKSSYIPAGLILLVSSMISFLLTIKTPQLPLNNNFISLLLFDKFTYFFWFIINFSAGLSVFISGSHFEVEGKQRNEIYPLMIFATAGALIFVAAKSALLLYLGLEIMSLAVYILVVFRKDDLKGMEGGIKYFLLGSFASIILLYGLSLLYGSQGSLDLVYIANRISTLPQLNPLTYGAMILILIGLLFKISAVPFHFWTPDAYEGAPVGITGYMAVVVKISAFAVLTRIIILEFSNPTLSSPPFGWAVPLWIISVVTMSAGNLIALKQQNIKRLLAFSSIAHAGYMLIAILSAYVLASDSAPNAAVQFRQGPISSLLFYLLAYCVTSIVAFGILGFMVDKNGERVNLENLRGLSKKHPLIAFTFAIALLSLIGMPGTVGFFAKFYLFKWGIEAKLYYLVITALINSVISAYYYLKVIVYMYMKEEETQLSQDPVHVSAGIGFAVLIATIFIFSAGILPSQFLKFALEASLF